MIFSFYIEHQMLQFFFTFFFLPIRFPSSESHSFLLEWLLGNIVLGNQLFARRRRLLIFGFDVTSHRLLNLLFLLLMRILKRFVPAIIVFIWVTSLVMGFIFPYPDFWWKTFACPNSTLITFDIFCDWWRSFRSQDFSLCERLLSPRDCEFFFNLFIMRRYLIGQSDRIII